MIKHSEYYTVSMAKEYSTQGYVDKALEIYKHLLKNSPEDKELQEAISNLEKRRDNNDYKNNNTKRDLSDLFEEWIDLLTRLKKIQSLKILHKRVKASPKN